jgi:hypothetical protein
LEEEGFGTLEFLLWVSRTQALGSSTLLVVLAGAGAVAQISFGDGVGFASLETGFAGRHGKGDH